MHDVYVYRNYLDQTVLNSLIQDFHHGADQDLPGRKFKTDTGQAQQILKSILSQVVPGRWNIDGGNYFLTERPYRLHVDTGKMPVKQLWYNIVIPLQLEFHAPYYENGNQLIITNQTWQGDAAFFVRGDTGATSEYNICVRDYSKVGNITNKVDSELLQLCTHLTSDQLCGFTIKKLVPWRPGDIILFKRELIHVTSNWRQAGVKQKLGLSLFTSYSEPGSV